MRYSLRTLTLGIVYVAFLCAGLVTGDSRWAAATLLMGLAIALYAGIHALFGPRVDKAYWASLVLGMVSYSLLASYTPFVIEANQIVQPLHRALMPLHVRWSAEPGFEPKQTGEGLFQVGPSQQANFASPLVTRELVQNALAVVAGLAAGQIGLVAARKRAAEQRPA